MPAVAKRRQRSLLQGCCTVLTEPLVFLGGPAEHHPSDEEVQVAEEDEGRGWGGAAVVLFDQLVALELPDCVSVVLHLLECVAAEKEGQGIEAKGLIVRR